ncbi:tetratricopeptide repeat protein [Azospirillum brasilense]|uniref:tetratricopeptide repeat protein n=1 Tax=Azospirillum brasilense TaxID=192 RepID=UPI00157BAA31|nr:tetratricopeptide repeat protein [Azospirillum brasilense]NUB27861.1 tetratricopeptide repeat protein [Azospirillum brasilense]NUB32977.1 tetratricopeptide repeat protein [Azospirillum brasilense]
MATVSEALSIALDHHIAGRVAEAETLYGRILEAVPGHPDASHLMGLLLAQTGRVAAALPHLDAAVTGDPASPTYHLNRGKVQDALGQTAAAAASWLATLRRQPDHGEAAERLAPALRVLAETAFDSGALASAAALYERVLALDPQNLSATFDAAMAAKGLGRLQEAAWLAGLSARLDPALLRARMAEAEARQVLGQTERAIAALRPALALDPAQGGCWASLCLLHNELGRGGAAVTAGRRAALAAPADTGLLVRLAAAQQIAEKPRPALAAARRGLSLDPASTELHLALGAALDAVHALETAGRALDRAGRLRPGDAAVLAEHGRLCERAGLTERAAALLQRALAARPDDGDSWVALGRAALRRGDAAWAGRCARRALRLTPGLPPGLLLAGAVREAQGADGEALALYDRVIAAAPGLGTGFSRRAMLLLRRAMGDAPPPRQPSGKRRLSVSTLGHAGRFGNQLLQYGCLRVCAERNGMELETPDWIGRPLYGLDDPLPGPPLPSLHEEDCGVPALLDGRALAGAGGHDVVGYFCGDTAPLAPHRERFRALFTPVGAVAERATAALDGLRARGRTLVAIHLRRGDFGRNDRFWIAPEGWYLDWLAGVWTVLDRPVLYLATDAPELADRFARYRPVLAGDLGAPLPGAEFFTDHWILSRADHVAVSNSSFSVTAALLNPALRAALRPDRERARLVPFDPWNGPVLLP